MTVIQGPITFKAGEEVPEAFKQSLKDSNIKGPFKEVKKKAKKSNKKSSNKKKSKIVKKKGVKK